MLTADEPLELRSTDPLELGDTVVLLVCEVLVSEELPEAEDEL